MSTEYRPLLPRLVLCTLGPLLLGVWACASVPRPRVMSEADQVAESPAAKDAAPRAPQAHAHAEKLRESAEAAYRNGDLAGAQILAEHSIAAYERAFILARLAKAQERVSDAEANLENARAKLAKIDEEGQRISAEADAIELKIRVIEDAQPLADPGKASPERIKARRVAARALLSQARLLCMATRLLDAKQAGLDEQFDKLAELEKSTANTPVPFTEVTRARSSCLQMLTKARRPALTKAPARGVSDALLEELTNTGKFFAFRDDRGVIVVLRDVFDNKNALTKQGNELVSTLGRIAKAHPEFPLLVVAHSAKASDSGDRARAESAAEALKKAGAPKATAHAVRDAQPIAEQKRQGSSARNTRLEVVFVSPAP